MQRINYESGAHWEETIGYSRAVKMGNIVEVSGTVSVDENHRLVGADNPYEQTKYILKKIEKVLERAGATLKDVVRTRIYVTDISKSEQFGRAHGEIFKEIRPCTSMIQVSALIAPEYLVEVEVSAIIRST